MNDDSLNLDKEPITLVFRRWPGSRDAEIALDESEHDTLVFRRWAGPSRAETVLEESEQDTLVHRRWPGPSRAETALDESEQDTLVHRRMAPKPPVASAPDESAAATRGPGRTEESTASGSAHHNKPDPKSDPAGDPSQIRPRVPEEIALLTGSLFDDLPRVEVPLETFFPAEYHNSAAWHRVRSDTLRPVAETSARRPPARRSSPNWFVGMAAAAVMGILAFAVVPRPATPSFAPPPSAAPPPPAAPLPSTGHATAVESPQIEAASAPTAAPRPAPETDRSPVKAPRAVSAAPLATDSTFDNTGAAPAPADSMAARADSTPAPGPAASPNEPVIAAMPIAPPAPPPPPEVPPQQTTAIAVASAARGATSCLAPDDPRRTMAVRVTFAPSGHATNAVIEGGPHRATLAGSCIAERLRGATIKPFEGPPITVHTSVYLR